MVELPSPGNRIRRARTDAGYSLSALARALYVDKAYLSRIENDRQQPSPAMLERLNRELGALVGMATGNAASSGDGVALVPERRPDGSVIITMMDRRAFLATATATVAVPAAVIELPDRVTSDTVTALSDRLDWHMAAGTTMHPEPVSRLVRADLDRIDGILREAPRGLRGPLLRITARYAEYLGWMRQEAGDPDGAMRWTNHAADLAHVADWRPMVGYTMIRKSRLLQYRRPAQAADLARAARTGPWRLSPGLVAFAASQQAEAHARAAQDRDARHALDVAGAALAHTNRANEPPLGPDVMARGATLTVDLWTARCELILGRAEPAIGPIHRLITEMNRPRAWSLNGAQLATAYAGVGAVDDAVRTVRTTLAAAGGCASATGAYELRAVRPALTPWAGRSDVRDLLADLPT
ncbi:MAG TPA: helix-turn-helix transcriptional regulator [Mycobacteriales bacterium]|nr:helix-turn-helix transcriptional regulator [Mycobacteriales bacterium]